MFQSKGNAIFLKASGNEIRSGQQGFHGIAHGNVNQMAAQGITLILEGANRILALNPIPAIPKDIPILKEITALEKTAQAIGVNKYTYYLRSREQLAPLLPFLENHYDLIIHHPDRYGEIVLKGISKATGMQRLLDFLLIKDEGFPESRGAFTRKA